jgi:hypothetical protein
MQIRCPAKRDGRILVSFYKNLIMADKKNTNNEKENKTGSRTQTGEPKGQNTDRPRQGSKTRGGLSPNPRQEVRAKDDADQPRRRRSNSSGSDGRHGGNR